MNCRDAQSLLQQLLDGELPVLLVEELEGHFFGCEDCARLYLDSFATEHSAEMSGTSSMLAAVILDTSGAICTSIRCELLSLADGACDEPRAVLLKQHLEGCENCSSLLEVLIALKSELPQLREYEPDWRFTSDVLRETSKRFKPQRSLGARVQEQLSNAWRRPRFSLEAAYVGSLVLALVLFITPVMTVQDLAARPVRLIESEVRGSLDSTSQLVRSELRCRSKTAESRFVEIQQEWGRRCRSWRVTLDESQKGLSESWQSLLDAKNQQAAKFFAWWRELVSGISKGTPPGQESSGPYS